METALETEITTGRRSGLLVKCISGRFVVSLAFCSCCFDRVRMQATGQLEVVRTFWPNVGFVLSFGLCPCFSFALHSTLHPLLMVLGMFLTPGKDAERRIEWVQNNKKKPTTLHGRRELRVYVVSVTVPSVTEMYVPCVPRRLFASALCVAATTAFGRNLRAMFLTHRTTGPWDWGYFYRSCRFACNQPYFHLVTLRCWQLRTNRVERNDNVEKATCVQWTHHSSL